MNKIILLLITSSIFILIFSHYVAGEEVTTINMDQKIDQVIDKISAVNKEIKQQNLFSIIIPIIVVVIAGLLALCQVKANIISSARIEWTQNLRKTLSLFLSEVMNINLHLREMASSYDSSNKDEFREKYIKQYDNFKKVNEYACQIKLFLNNQKEKDHRDLQVYIEKYVDKATKDKEFDDIDYLDDMQNIIIETSQKILKQAWEDAKTFKLRDIFKFGI